ncbi:MAG: EpsI family protein [Betaproteobacteria bacterium CG2_30_68_42]|nr:MAG: EpsI family protein [Betaproteobacteria bacterium CG2_30_68_42]
MGRAAAGALALKPTKRIADAAPPIDLETMIPKRFGDWKVDPNIVPLQVSPDVRAKLDKIYNQVLSRTYVNVNGKGQRVMLSIAYGGDQSSDNTQVHRPEYCYAAQGFRLENVFENTISTAHGDLPVRRLLAVQGSPNEPITYWITIDDKIALPGLQRKILQLRNGLTGKVPDGMLVRVSSFSRDNDAAYRAQDKFVGELLSAMSEADRIRVAGRPVR